MVPVMREITGKGTGEGGDGGGKYLLSDVVFLFSLIFICSS